MAVLKRGLFYWPWSLHTPQSSTYEDWWLEDEVWGKERRDISSSHILWGFTLSCQAIIINSDLSSTCGMITWSAHTCYLNDWMEQQTCCLSTGHCALSSLLHHVVLAWWDTSALLFGCMLIFGQHLSKTVDWDWRSSSLAWLVSRPYSTGLLLMGPFEKCDIHYSSQWPGTACL